MTSAVLHNHLMPLSLSHTHTHTQRMAQLTGRPQVLHHITSRETPRHGLQTRLSGSIPASCGLSCTYTLTAGPNQAHYPTRGHELHSRLDMKKALA